MKNSNILLGYDYDKWYGYGVKEAIEADISTKTNSHTLLCGMSGSGKSFAMNIIFAKTCITNNMQGKVHFADFKQDDQFEYLRGCSRYYPYNKSIDALEIVYDILHKRQLGEDKSREPVTLIWDEYMANILAIQSVNKKKAEEVVRKVSEILMVGRSLGCRLLISCQRADSSPAFNNGSKLNFGIIVIVGAAIKSIYEMLLPKEYIELIGDRQFGIGEGVVLLQGSQLHFIKVPMVRNEKQMQQICIDALTM